MFYFANLSTFAVIHSMRAIFSSILAFFWWNLPLSSCSIPYSLDFLNSRCLGFLYWLYFHFLVLNSFIQFFPLCSCFPGFFFGDWLVFYLRIIIFLLLFALTSFSCTSAMSEYWQHVVVVLLGSCGDILYSDYCLFLCWCLCIWDWKDYSPGYWCLVLSFLCGWFVSLFLFPLLFLGEFDTCLFLSRTFSLDFESVAIGFWVKCVSQYWQLTLMKGNRLGVWRLSQEWGD